MFLAVDVVESSLKVSELGVFFLECSQSTRLCCSNNVLGPSAPMWAGHPSIKLNWLMISRGAVLLGQHPLGQGDLLHPLGVARELVVSDPLRDVV